MEEGEDQVMSEVHLGCPPRFSGPYISHFTFSLPSTDVVDERTNNISPTEASSSQNLSLDNDSDLAGYQAKDNDHILEQGTPILTLDEDGDLVLNRRRNEKERCLSYALAIQHNISSSLWSVGLQVWRAALLLADFVLHKGCTSCDFNGITAIELGAGTGLVGIALARIARTVFITDRDTDILENCTTNAQLNSSLLKFQDTKVHVRELDWKESWPPTVGNFDLLSHTGSRYSWTSSEIEEAERATVILAADVIYSDDLTDLFFSILEKLMSHGSEKVLYLALEKRYNFSMNDLDVVANGYAHFRSFLKDDEECGSHDDASLPVFRGKQIDLSEIPQYIREYERGKDLEIWEITYCSDKLK
ncbi:uncharacterized protein [Typha angustifolia]|uniref:uncharacterized protein isoform X1 n=1 Tax=Typha angustifolia TaxID=59011 RepID=UPI003C2E7269